MCHVLHTAFARLAACLARHQMLYGVQELMVSPELLRLHSIPVVKVIQYPGEFILNSPGKSCHWASMCFESSIAVTTVMHSKPTPHELAFY